ncbi:MAG: tRNA 2-thiouridine(34) synthase MnmA [Rickettsiales bacterium]|nr:tRNA 2-thiouridine(34) synthase MnmA [Rickettsiales bacterium]|tara:strand:- start:10534 stop:11658 length:1125 start_codon:yes stop_codon:yes gene_type:complete
MHSTNPTDLGFTKKPQDTRVVVAMSGGVDSSVAAALMVEAGYDVVGVTLQLYDHGLALEKKGACCAGQDIYDASVVADKMGFPHYVLDYESRFKQDVIDDFADSYLKGETPIPCIRCNQTVKFRDLYKTAKDLNAEALITGHYVRRLMGANGAELHRAIDPTKDQSYFLFSTTQNQLDYLRFPLGGQEKAETRALAERFGLEVADKPDSQDICFVPNGNYTNLVRKLRPESIVPGNIVHLDGTIMGTHPGIIGFTIGQRKGLGIGGRKDDTSPLYVVDIRPESHEVVVGPQEALAKKSIKIKEVNWLAGRKDSEPMKCHVKIRSTHHPVPATIEFTSASEALIHFDTPEYGVASGQAAVCYDGSRVLGGGWITG